MFGWPHMGTHDISKMKTSVQLPLSTTLLETVTPVVHLCTPGSSVSPPISPAPSLV